MTKQDEIDVAITAAAMALLVIGEEVEQPGYSGKPRMKRYIELLEDLVKVFARTE